MKKIFSLFLLSLFVAQIYGAVLFFPQRANAQPVPTGVMTDIPGKLMDAAHKIAEKAKDVAKKIGESMNTDVFYRTVMNFTQRLSSSIGKTLAEGGKGGGSFFDGRSLENAVKEAGEAAIGDAMDDIGKGLGVNLCLPPEIKLGLSLGLAKALEPTKPKCTFQEFKDKWQKFGESFSDEEIFSQHFSAALNPAQSEVGLTAYSLLKVDADAAKAEHEAEVKRLADKGYEGKKDPISGQVTTPPDILAEQGKQNFVIQLPGSMEPKLTGELWPDVKTVAIYNFFATFTETAMKRIFEGIFAPKPPKPSRRGVLGSLGSGSTSSGGGAKATDVQGVSFSSTGSEFDLLTEFTTCHEAGQSIYNCVLDQNFAQAIRDGVTIREAIKNNFNNRLDGAVLNVTLPFGYGGADGQQQLRHDSGYAYHNLKKLRRARIIPVGWELAAEIIKARRQSANFGEVLRGFGDTASPFYRLVDPDWLLKAPLYYCKATAPGQLVTPGSEDRLEYCVDLQDCVAPTEDGNGCQSWGYCTRERNTWRFDAKQCEAQFNTCLAYKRQHDSQTFAFNKNTTKACDANEVGCRWFALEKNGVTADAKWKLDPRRYFNRTVAECSAQANGCTEFVRLTNKTTGKPLTMPQYVSAKDTAVAASKNYEDYSAEQNATFATKRQTIKYIGGTLNDCRGPQGNEAANVGCERFTPTSGVDAPVPAVLQSNDECPTSCVGYDAYEEVPSIFSKGHFPEYFIPNSARACTADAVGCEEFTNLDAVGKQGEAREYFTTLRQCQKPATDSRTYYTWVGTEKTGYQLETHSLKASNLDGGKAPCTTRDLQNGNVCNEVVQGGVDSRALCVKADLLTNPDCREFYDEQGNISYRLYSKTIVSSDACIRYRMTRSEGAENCRDTGGEWSGTSCIYLVLPQESRSCSADAAGCREYKGNTANDIRIVAQENFEKAYKDAAGARIPPPVWTGTLSNESLAQNGHSIAGENLGAQRRVAVTPRDKDGATDIHRNRTYLLSFWAKATNASTSLLPAFSLPATMPDAEKAKHQSQFARNILTQGRGSQFTQSGDFQLTNVWQQYAAGPVFVTWTPDADQRLEFNSADGEFVIDTVTLTEVRDDFYLIKDSWTTPRACLYKDDGSLRAGDDRVIGCRAYTDRAKNPYAVKAFHQLCKEEFVGCEALVNTQNTTKPEAKDFGNGMTVGPDAIAYVVNDPKNYCTPSEKGCSAVSAPQAVDLGGVFAANTVYKLNDPEKYLPDAQGKGSILCTAQNLACEAYTKSAGGEDYFIDPYAKVTPTGKPTTCEWKLWPETLTQQFGWFNKGSSSKTPDCNAGFVKECPQEADRCSQFFDPQDLSRSVVRSMMNESFEATTVPPGWIAGVSPPTTLTIETGGIIEQRTLRARGSPSYVSFTLGSQSRPGPIRKGGAYRLSFWVKGNGGNVVTWFGGAPTGGYFEEQGGRTSLPITGDWTYHRLTRIATANESGVDQNLRFEGGGNLTDLYLDGVVLEAITDVNDTGRPFYIIDDEVLTKKRDRTQCAVVDQKAGCVLFQSANKGASVWDSTLSYQAGTPVQCSPGETVCVGARDTNNGKVYGRGTDAATCTASGGKGIACIGPDANDLLKVKRDRVCGEWLSCVSGTQVLDKQTQKLKNVCYSIGTCTEPSPTNATACGRMKDVDRDPQLLTVDLYKARDLTWQGKEYAGYSIPYQYPVTNFVQLPHAADPSTKVPAGYRLHSLALDYDAQGKPRTCTKNNAAIADGGCGVGSGKECIFRGQGIGDLRTGLCYVDKGSGQEFALPGTQGASIPEIQKSCRAYPSTDAPFPESVASIWHDTFKTSAAKQEQCPAPAQWNAANYECVYDTKNVFPEFATPKVKDGAFIAANVSQKTSPRYTYGPAECSYRRVRSKDGTTRFWGITGSFPDDNIDILRNEYGWQGYCLETDISQPTAVENGGAKGKTACFTWFPVDLVQGEVDINADAPEAGYQVAPTKRFYCVGTALEERRGWWQETSCQRSRENCGGTAYTVKTDNCVKSGGHARRQYGCQPYDVAERDEVGKWFPYNTSTDSRTRKEVRDICTKIVLIQDPETNQSAGWTERLLGPLGDPQIVKPRPLNDTISAQLAPITIASPNAPYGATDGIQNTGTNIPCVDNSGQCGPLVLAQYKPGAPNGGTSYVTGDAAGAYQAGLTKITDTIFARTFGVWNFGWSQQCDTRCIGGPLDGKSCASAADCKAIGTPTCRLECAVDDPTLDLTKAPQSVLTDIGARDLAAKQFVSDAIKTDYGPLVTNPPDPSGMTQFTALDPAARATFFKEKIGAYIAATPNCAPSNPPTKSCVSNIADDPVDGASCTTDADCRASGQCGVPAGCQAGGAGYQLLPAYQNPWSISQDVTATGEAPKVIFADYNNLTQTYKEGTSGITVETKHDGVISYDGATAQAVSVKFYAYNANGQQMPLKRVIVDWGDQTDLSVTKGSLKNRKNQCNRTCSQTTNADGTKKHCSKKEDCSGGVSDLCEAANWSDDVHACIEDTQGGGSGYFTYTHIYRCEGPTSAGWQDDTGGGKGGCVFVPKVQVMDNWGWCNGTCSAKGCYNDLRLTRMAQCDSSPEAWTRFGSGTDAVILRP